MSTAEQRREQWHGDAWTRTSRAATAFGCVSRGEAAGRMAAARDAGESGLERYRGRRRRFWPGRGAWAASGRAGGETAMNGVSRVEDEGEGKTVINSKFKIPV